MPKLLRNLLVLTLIITAPCLNTMDNATISTEMSLLVTSTSKLMTITTEENSSTLSTTVVAQDDSISKNLSHTLSLSSSSSDGIWECPNIIKTGVTCSCDFPHTLRCIGDRTTLQVQYIQDIPHKRIHRIFRKGQII